MATQGTGVLQIVGAAYGLRQVTAQVIKQVNRQAFPETLSVLASNQAFGDAWVGHEKTLTVVYRYDGGPTFVATALEGQTLNIGAQQFGQAAQVPAPIKEDNTAQPALTVWGASFGSADVSATVRNLADHSAGTLSLVADSATLGEADKERRNTFVIVASYSGQVPFIDIVVEGNPYALSYRPPLHILNAFYGLKDVTDIVRASVSRRRLSVAASSSVFGDGWPAMRKTLHVVYQYAGRKPQLAATIENQLLQIDYDPAAPAAQASLDPRALNILAAAYGPVDVTAKVVALVENGSLSFTADSLTFGDTWPAAVKSFSMVYSWGVAAISSVNVPEDTPVSITQPEPAFTTDRNFVSLAGLLAAGDEIKLQTGAAGYWSIAADGRITALGTSSDAAEVFTIGVPEALDAAAITLQCRDGSYVSADSDGTLRAGGSAQDAIRLMASLQANGAINIGVVGGAGAPFIAVTASGAIAIDGSYEANFSTCFNLLLSPTRAGNASHLQAFASATVLDGPVDMKLVNVVWKLTGGCFLAAGLGRLLGDPQQIGPALYRFLRRYPGVMNKIAILIATIDCNRAMPAGALLGVLKAIHEAGILMPVLRMTLATTGWMGMSWAIVTILTKVQGGVTSTGATAGGELGESFSDWAYETTMEMLDYINSTGGAALMLAYERMVSADQPVLRRAEGGGAFSLRERMGPQDISGSFFGPMPRPFRHTCKS
ncbi:hypothetical protein ABIB38_002188 [Massilia sp. UYP11]|uniref:hypothetical protein n=1 Tax=Massilia sp. UYP11 TaxID=1756385 RepID=UPI003D2059C9